MTKKSLAYLNYSDTLKRIVEDHPKLLYFICYWEDPNRFPILPFLDIELDCKQLDNHNIIDYKSKSRGERHTHRATRRNCPLTTHGQLVFRDMDSKGVCEEILKLIDLMEKEGITLNNENFNQKFKEYFTFEEDLEKRIEKKLKELRDRFYLNFPDNHHHFEKNGNHFYLEYEFKNDDFYIIIRVKCACSYPELTEMEIEEGVIHAWKSYIIKCEKCVKIFYVSVDLNFCPYIIG